MINKRKIGIIGGTFDPIHYGHLIMAETARDILNLEKVLFIPTGNPPHKLDEKVTNKEHRLNMVKLAILSNPFFEASRIEIDRPGNTYAVDTLKELKTMYGEAIELLFIIGADVVFDLEKWKDYEEVFKLCHFIAFQRSGFEDLDLNQRIQALYTQHKAIIHKVEMPVIEISSTDIRSRIIHGRSIKYLLPSNVSEYLQMYNIYK